jgi:hypothetical protein
MSTWTKPALERLEEYLRKNRERAEATGADPDEVAADLRQHIENEVEAQKLQVVTEEDIGRIISRTGVLPEPETREPITPLITRARVKRAAKPVASGALLFFGVIQPLATLIIELSTHICAGTLFDPLPTWFHVFLIASIPVANACAWSWLRDENRTVPQWLWWLNGVAVGSGTFYSLLFLPISPFALLAILFFGFGLMPLAPLFSLICTLRLRSRLGKRQREQSNVTFKGWWWSTSAAVVLLVLFALPEPLTQHWMDVAGSESPEEALHAVRMLRRFGSEDTMLKQCYGRRDRWMTDIWDSRWPDSGLAQKTFYRVTGKAYNSVSPPFSKYQKSARPLFDEFEFDDGLGGENVAGKVRGLSLNQSRIDGLSQPNEGWAYLQWTMEFRNDHEWNQREARAQIQLPPGGVVSRVTLWVNGEPREAAFAGKSEVRAAYQQVAVRERRDPVLVTMCGPDRVLVQCFPIPPKGGLMKIRLGITAPLSIEQTNSAQLRMPCFTERNFKMSSGFEHSLWLETPEKVDAKFAKLTVDNTQPGKSGVRGQIKEDALSANDAILKFEISTAKLATLHAADPKSKGRVVRQTLETVPTKMPTRLAIVLDGSKEMTQAFPEIAKALHGIPSVPELSIWLAKDGVQNVFNRQWRNLDTAPSTISALRGAGGQDDVPALLEAWEWAAAQTNSTLIWIHGAQPVLLTGVEALRQRFDWKSGPAARLEIRPCRANDHRCAIRGFAESHHGTIRRFHSDRFTAAQRQAQRRPGETFRDMGRTPAKVNLKKNR